MAKEWEKKFLNRKPWKVCRASFIAKRRMIDGGMCMCCGRVPGYIVHHTVHLTPANIDDPEISLNHELLSYECKDCHDKHEGHGIGNKGAGLLVDFDEEGQPVPISPPEKKPGY